MAGQKDGVWSVLVHLDGYCTTPGRAANYDKHTGNVEIAPKVNASFIELLS